MATIASIAADHDMQPHELAALTGFDHIGQSDELDDDTEAIIRDVVGNTDNDGVYRTTMTAAEFQTTREALGLTGDWLAGHLNVSPRTVRNWEQGKYAVPVGVDYEMHKLRGAAYRHYKQLATKSDEIIGGGGHVEITVYRSTEDYHAAVPGATMPASWHRAIAYRVRELLPTVTLAYPNDAPKRTWTPRTYDGLSYPEMGASITALHSAGANRRAHGEALLPALRLYAADESVGEAERITHLARATRAFNRDAPRPDSPWEALAALEEAVEAQPRES